MATAKLARAAHTIENWLDRIRPQRGDDPLIVEPYIGYSVPGGAVLRGRVLEEPTSDFINSLAGKLGTPGAMARNFFTDEVAGIEVICDNVSAVSDEEGYFQLEVPPNSVDGGVASVVLRRSGDCFDLPVAITPEDASHGVISDIDDTIIQTGAWHLARNMWTTFTTSSTARVVYEDTCAILRKHHDRGEPVFFVSSSPWNLHQYLTQVFEHNNVPPGPMFLRDLGLDENKFIKSSHGSHKGDAIDTILAANPALTFTLIGDTGQHDAQVYLDAIARHQGRISEVYLRKAGTYGAADEAAAEALKNTGIRFHSGETLG